MAGSKRPPSRGLEDRWLAALVRRLPREAAREGVREGVRDFLGASCTSSWTSWLENRERVEVPMLGCWEASWARPFCTTSPRFGTEVVVSFCRWNAKSFWTWRKRGGGVEGGEEVEGVEEVEGWRGLRRWWSSWRCWRNSRR